MSTKLNLFGYEDYRLFIRDKFEQMRQDDPTLSYRQFSKRAGLGAPNYVTMIIEGKRNLTAPTVSKFIKAFEFDRHEAFYFRNLVALNQAGSVDERLLYASQVLKSRGFKKAHPLAEYQQHYFTRWYFVAIRELVGLPDFEEDPEEIAKRLNGLVTAAEAKKALDELLKLNLIRRSESGRLVQVRETILTPDEVTASFGAVYHDQMLTLAREAINRYPREMREFYGLTFPINSKNMQELKEAMQRFVSEVIQIVGQETDPNCLFQFNLQLFPMALIKDKNR